MATVKDFNELLDAASELRRMQTTFGRPPNMHEAKALVLQAAKLDAIIERHTALELESEQKPLTPS